MWHNGPIHAFCDSIILSNVHRTFSMELNTTSQIQSLSLNDAGTKPGLELEANGHLEITVTFLKATRLPSPFRRLLWLKCRLLSMKSAERNTLPLQVVGYIYIPSRLASWPFNDIFAIMGPRYDDI